MMPKLSALLKPCYVFAPRVLVRRIGIAASGKEPLHAVIRLPWGAALEVNAGEVIGREIFRQNVFDIAVSEVAWRLLAPGDVAIDVGANIGYMTTLFATRVGPSGRVESFEPHPRIFARLQSNLARNPAAAGIVRLHDVALGSRGGFAQLVEPEMFNRNEGTSVVVDDAGSDLPRSSGKRFAVRIERLDSMLAGSRIALLKLDVEGFEREVLAGAEQLLSSRSVRNIVYEAHDCALSPLHDLLGRSGYTVFGIGHTLLGPKLSVGADAPSVDRAWESPSYLASLDPDTASELLRPRGWRVLRGG